jgi:Tfp pilus assembly protein PilF
LSLGKSSAFVRPMRAARRKRVSGSTGLLALLACVEILFAGCGGLSRRPSDPAARAEAYVAAERGRERLQAVDARGAIKQFERALALAPDMTFAYLGRGLAYGRQHRWAAALADHQRAIELDPESAVVRYLRGTVYAERGDHERAIVDFGDAIAFDRTFWQAYAARGHEYRRIGDANRARADFQLAIDLHRKLVRPSLTNEPRRQRQPKQAPPVESPERILATMYPLDKTAARVPAR